MRSLATVSHRPRPAADESAQGPLARLIADGAIRSVFQPIAKLNDGSLYAHEALVRGPQSMPLHMPDALFAAARREGLLEAFELECVETALETWSRLAEPGRLFVNISANALLATARRRSVPSLVESIRRLGLHPRLLTFEVTEHELVTDVDSFVQAAREVQAEGISFALDDFGDGRSSLRLWSELGPDVVKIDKYLIHGISSRPRKLQTVRALMQIADVFGTTLVAEGIETADDLRVVRDLGIELGQGYLLGRPVPNPTRCVEPGAAEVLVDRRVAVLPALGSAASPARMRAMRVIDADPVAVTATCEEVAALFHAHPSWPALAFVDDGRPLAILERHTIPRQLRKTVFQGDLRENILHRLCQHVAEGNGARRGHRRPGRHPDVVGPALLDGRVHRDRQRTLRGARHRRSACAKRDRVADRGGATRESTDLSPGKHPN